MHGRNLKPRHHLPNPLPPGHLPRRHLQHKARSHNLVATVRRAGHKPAGMTLSVPQHGGRHREDAKAGGMRHVAGHLILLGPIPVSYTHLTLPTIYSV